MSEYNLHADETEANVPDHECFNRRTREIDSKNFNSEKLNKILRRSRVLLSINQLIENILISKNKQKV